MTRVMIVDDHPMWREGVARDLGGRGYDVCATASDVASAVKIGVYRMIAHRPGRQARHLARAEGPLLDHQHRIAAGNGAQK